jgi:hypothetical protein
MQESRLHIRNADPEQVVDIVRRLLEARSPQKELVFFINLTKNLAVRHLKGSEYYMTEYLEYKLVPDPFQGCAGVPNNLIQDA